jgi:hypothetical protein
LQRQERRLGQRAGMSPERRMSSYAPSVSAEANQPWWFIDGDDYPHRRDTVFSLLLVFVFAVGPALLGWPWWTWWVSPMAWLAILLLFVQARLTASRRWKDRTAR